MIPTVRPRAAQCVLLPALVCLLFAVDLAAQGRSDLLNVESPPIHPLEIARLGDLHVLLVANTADSSVEVWHTDESLPTAERFIARIPTGLDPVSVRWNAQLGRFYTANMLGDSITVGRLELSPHGEVLAVLERTRNVGDEPMDIGFASLPAHTGDGSVGLGGPLQGPSQPGLPSGPVGRLGVVEDTPDPAPKRPVLIVSLASSHRLQRIDAFTLAPIGPRIELVDHVVEPPRSLREPRHIEVREGHTVVLGLKGGNSEIYDFDVFIGDENAEHVASLAGLGSTNAAMTFDASGDLFVVGGEAQNHLQSEPLVAAAPTGFVKSTLYWVHDPLGQPQVARRDLNALADPPGGTPTPVGPERALALPTDVVVFQPSVGPRKVFIAASGSDRVGVVVPLAGQTPTDWTTRVLELPPPPGSGLIASGPRALALRPRYGPTHAPARLYVLERFSNRISVIDPLSEALVDGFALGADPTPEWVREGRPWLYSARDTSGGGFVSCASCHVEGRTDGLVWNLGDPAAPRDPFPLHLVSGLPLDQNHDGDCDDDFNLLFEDFVVDGFPQKFGMMTQSLQGLLNFETEPAGETAAFFTNSAYHWRADRPGLEAFNGAFVGLQGMPAIPGSDPPQGLDAAQMGRLVEFVNSIHYPPNPHQPVTRSYEGSLGDPSDAESGWGTLRGLKLFHTQPVETTFGMSCSQCHWLPEGSDNRITQMAPETLFFQPLETAALRGMEQKHARRDDGPNDLSEILLGDAGLSHSGGNASINAFDKSFTTDFGEPQHVGFPELLIDVNDYMAKFDWGVAPIIGQVHSIASGDPIGDHAHQVLNLLESQARLANAGVAVHGRLGSVKRGYWYDLSATPPIYRREPDGATFTRSDLLDQLGPAGNLLVFQSVPLGSERRIASRDAPAPIPGPAPSDVELLGLATGTAYELVPTLTKNWSPFESDPDQAFNWVNSCSSTPRGVRGVRMLQWGLLQDAASEGAFGLDQLRHEAPRRVRLAGDDIRHGAVLHLHMPAGIDPPDTSAGLAGTATSELVLNLYPTGATLGGRTIWETSAELDALGSYALLLGGPAAPGVFEAAFDTFDSLPEPPLPGTFDPLAWNWFWVRIVNLDGSSADAGWQRLRLL